MTSNCYGNVVFYFATGSAQVQVRPRNGVRDSCFHTARINAQLAHWRSSNGTMTHQMPDGDGDKPMQAKRAAFAHHEWAGPGI